LKLRSRYERPIWIRLPVYETEELELANEVFGKYAVAYAEALRRVPSSEGIVPDNQFEERSSVWRLTMLPRYGRVPLKVLEAREREVREDRLENDEGVVPLRRLYPRYRKERLVALPSHAGIVPLS
jgi:hypothetical protein